MRNNKGELIGNERFPEKRAVPGGFPCGAGPRERRSPHTPQVSRRGFRTLGFVPFPRSRRVLGAAMDPASVPFSSPTRHSRLEIAHFGHFRLPRARGLRRLSGLPWAAFSGDVLYKPSSRPTHFVFSGYPCSCPGCPDGKVRNFAALLPVFKGERRGEGGGGGEGAAAAASILMSL